MQKSIFRISKMDCSSEEQLIKMKLQAIEQIQQLEFDITNRQLVVYHNAAPEPINNAINELDLNCTLLKTEQAGQFEEQDHSGERKLLWTILIINFGLFVIELSTGFFSNSMSLVADSLDMLADAIVYGLSLYAVGKMANMKKRVAKIGGYFQITLAIFGLLEVVRRFLGYEEVPVFQTMIFISILALIGNAVSLFLLRTSKSQEVHIKASMVFTNNDVIVNIGVIIAGIAVYLTHSKYPDLIVGSMVFLLVVRGAVRILKIAK
jgi:Co/Zn/Cd efflux system component